MRPWMPTLPTCASMTQVRRNRCGYAALGGWLAVAQIGCSALVDLSGLEFSDGGRSAFGGADAGQGGSLVAGAGGAMSGPNPANGGSGGEGGDIVGGGAAGVGGLSASEGGNAAGAAAAGGTSGGGGVGATGGSGGTVGAGGAGGAPGDGTEHCGNDLPAVGEQGSLRNTATCTCCKAGSNPGGYSVQASVLGMTAAAGESRRAVYAAANGLPTTLLCQTNSLPVPGTGTWELDMTSFDCPTIQPNAEVCHCYNFNEDAARVGTADAAGCTALTGAPGTQRSRGRNYGTFGTSFGAATADGCVAAPAYIKLVPLAP